jgi:FSR family fosmidomycin resistance protein-like MFS transporter
VSVAAVPARRREIEAIALVGFGHGVSHFFHLMIPPLFPFLMREFGLSYTQAGALSATFFAVSGIGQALAGFVVDRVGARRVLLAGMSLFIVSGVALGLAPNYAALLAAAAIAGLGNSVFHPADFTLLNRNVTGARLGHAFSVHGLSGNLGWALAPVFMTGITVASSWRVAAFCAALLAAAPLILFFLRRDTVTEPPLHAGAHEAKGAAGSTFAFLRSAAVWMCFSFFLFLTVASAAQQNFGPSVLQHVYGMSLAAGASALTAFLLGGAAGIAVGGFLVARYDSHDRLIALVLALAGLCALVLATGGAPVWSVTALMAAMGFCTGLAGPSRDMLVRRAATARFGTAAFGRVYGFVYSGIDVGFAFSPVLVLGPLMDAGRFQAVLVVAAAAQAFAILTALGVGRGAAPAAVPVKQDS